MLRQTVLLVVLGLLLAGCSDDSQNDDARAAADQQGNKNADAIGRANPASENDADSQSRSSGSTDAEQGSVAAKKPQADKKTAQQLFNEAGREFNEGDVDAAVRLVDQAVEAEPDDRRVLLTAVNATQTLAGQLSQSGKREQANELFLKSARYMRALQQRHAPLKPIEKQFLPQVLYNEACAYATSDREEEALDSLRAAVEAGFDDLNLMESDKDLAGLRATAEFNSLKEQVEKQLAEFARNEIAETESFPFEFSLPSATDEKTISLADYKGQVVIADFWGTWCPPCRMEIPHFVELQKKYGQAGLKIVGINYERSPIGELLPPDEARKKIQEFMKDTPLNYPCVLAEETTPDAVPGFQGFPTTLFIDRSGKVRAKLVGYTPMSRLEALVKLLLEEPAGKTQPGGDR